MNIDWNFVLSILTVGIAGIALFLTNRQTTLSNKQHLFDKRIENYLIAKGIIQLYEENRTLLAKDGGVIFDVDYMFSLMTNNTYMESISNVISHPKENPYHKEFLIKLETLKDISMRTKLIFYRSSSRILGDFILKYKELLFSMYQYKILLEHVKNAAEKLCKTFDESLKSAGEAEFRQNLREAISNLEQSYNTLKEKKVEKRIEKQIRLRLI